MEPPRKVGAWEKSLNAMRTYFSSEFTATTVRDLWQAYDGPMKKNVEIVDYLAAYAPKRAAFFRVMKQHGLGDASFDLQALIDEAESQAASPAPDRPPATPPRPAPSDILLSSSGSSSASPAPSISPSLTSSRGNDELWAFAARLALVQLSSGEVRVDVRAYGENEGSAASKLAAVLKVIFLAEHSSTPLVCSVPVFFFLDIVVQEVCEPTIAVESSFTALFRLALSKLRTYVAIETRAGLPAHLVQPDILSDADFRLLRESAELITSISSKWAAVASSPSSLLLTRISDSVNGIKNPIPLIASTTYSPELPKSEVVKVLEWNFEETRVVYHSDPLTALGKYIKRAKLNCISVVGPSRHGKSFLLSSILHLTAPKEATRFVSNTVMTGTTVGTDMFSRLVSPKELEFNAAECLGLILLDVEGLGHKDTQTMSRLLLPAMMISQVVVYNVRDLRREDVLNEVAIYASMARHVRQRTKEKIFGHLVILVRDWKPAMGNPKALYDFLLKTEPAENDRAKDRNGRRDIITETFDGVTLHCLPRPYTSADSLDAPEIPWEDVPEQYWVALRQLLVDLKGYFNSKVPFFKSHLTGDRLEPLFRQIVSDSNSNAVDVDSLVTAMLRLECQSAKDDAFIAFKAAVREQYRPSLPRKAAGLSFALDNLLQLTVANFEVTVSHISKELVAAHLKAVQEECKLLMDELRAENANKIADECEKLTTSCVTDLLQTEFMAAQPRPINILIEVAKGIIKAKWPPYADDNLLRKKLDLAAETVTRKYKAPTIHQLRNIIERIAALSLGGRLREARDNLNSWLKFLLQCTPSDLKLFAYMLHPAQANLAGPLLEQAFATDPDSFSSDPPLLCEFGHYLASARQWDKAEGVYKQALVAETKRGFDLSGAYRAYADYWISRKMPDKALPLYEKALEHRPLTRGIFYLWPRCWKKLRKLDRAKEEAVKMISLAQAEASKETLIEAIYNLSRRHLISDVRAVEILVEMSAVNPSNGFIWAVLFCMAYRQQSKEKMREYVHSVMDTFVSVPATFRVTISVALGEYWWKFATPANYARAEAFLFDAVRRSAQYQTIHLLHQFYRDTGNVNKAEEVMRQISVGPDEQNSAPWNSSEVPTGGAALPMSSDAAKAMAQQHLLAGRPAEAEKIYRDLLQNFRASEEGDPERAALLTSLASSVSRQGKQKDALEILNKVLPLRMKVLGEDHTDTLATRTEIALAMQGLGQIAEAKIIFQEVYERRSAKLGADHADTLASMRTLAIARWLTADLTEAAVLLTQLLEKKRRTSPELDPQLMEISTDLTSLLREMGDNKLVLVLVQSEFAKLRRFLGAENFLILPHQYDLACAHYFAGDWDQAYAEYCAALEIAARSSATATGSREDFGTGKHHPIPIVNNFIEQVLRDPAHAPHEHGYVVFQGMPLVTPIWYDREEGRGWRWSPDRVHWMPVRWPILVRGGEWDGKAPAAVNQHIIKALRGQQ